MNKQESKEQVSLPSCPNPNCRESHVVRNGSHRGRQRYCCRNCKTYFGETQGTPTYGLKTPAAEVAQALLIVMRRGSLRAATHAAALTQVLASDLHLSQVEIDEFWSFVQKKKGSLASLTRESAGHAWCRTGTAASWSPAPAVP